MLFDKITPGLVIGAMVEVRKWQRVTTDKKDLDGILLTTDRKAALTSLASVTDFEQVLIYPGITFHFTKQPIGGKLIHAWIDADHHFLLTHDAFSKTGQNKVKMLDWLEGLEYIDQTYGDDAARARAKNFKELAQPRPA